MGFKTLCLHMQPIRDALWLNYGLGTAVSSFSWFVSVATFPGCSAWPSGPLDFWTCTLVGIARDSIVESLAAGAAADSHFTFLPSNWVAFEIVGVFLVKLIGNRKLPSEHEVCGGIFQKLHDFYRYSTLHQVKIVDNRLRLFRIAVVGCPQCHRSAHRRWVCVLKLPVIHPGTIWGGISEKVSVFGRVGGTSLGELPSPSWNL